MGSSEGELHAAPLAYHTSPLKLGWRSMPSSVTPRNSIRAEIFGLTHTVSFLRSGFAVGGVRRISGSSLAVKARRFGGFQSRSVGQRTSVGKELAERVRFGPTVRNEACDQTWKSSIPRATRSRQSGSLPAGGVGTSVGTSHA